jgi:hypothetical protein
MQKFFFPQKPKTLTSKNHNKSFQAKAFQLALIVSFLLILMNFAYKSFCRRATKSQRQQQSMRVNYNAKSYLFNLVI